MAASHLEMFQLSTADETEILKLVENHFLPDRGVLRWWLAKGEDIPTPNMKEIMVLSSFFQRRFGLPSHDFFCGLLHHYQIELIHLNTNSILQVTIFMDMCEPFIIVPPSFSLFNSYFFLKYQPSVDNRKVIGGVGLQTHPHSGFLDLPMKTSLKEWHKSWFYYENHQSSLPSFISRLHEFDGTWSQEPTTTKHPIVAALAN
jgi:hypothetical protein